MGSDLVFLNIKEFLYMRNLNEIFITFIVI